MCFIGETCKVHKKWRQVKKMHISNAKNMEVELFLQSNNKQDGNINDVAFKKVRKSVIM